MECLKALQPPDLLTHVLTLALDNPTGPRKSLLDFSLTLGTVYATKEMEELWMRWLAYGMLEAVSSKVYGLDRAEHDKIVSDLMDDAPLECIKKQRVMDAIFRETSRQLKRRIAEADKTKTRGPRRSQSPTKKDVRDGEEAEEVAAQEGAGKRKRGLDSDQGKGKMVERLHTPLVVVLAEVALVVILVEVAAAATGARLPSSMTVVDACATATGELMLEGDEKSYQASCVGTYQSSHMHPYKRLNSRICLDDIQLGCIPEQDLEGL
ncbi:hypothetical protein E8E11_004671 [Didymella keratinophila]|nr:hypothetical protein E8E11_004671 [Didymella keratinophila]